MDAAADDADSTTDDGLDERDRVLVHELLTRRSVHDAALAAGCSDRTVFRRMREPAFQSALRRARAQALAASGTQLVGATSIATTALVDVCEDKDAPHAARVSAAREILSAAMRFVEGDDLREEIERIKAWRAEQEAKK